VPLFLPISKSSKVYTNAKRQNFYLRSAKIVMPHIVVLLGTVAIAANSLAVAAETPTICPEMASEPPS